jgi:hypothetical protein
MALDATNNRLNVALEGGTISGDVTISGDLTVSGSNTYTYDEQIDGQLWLKDSGASASDAGGHLRLFSDDGAVMASGHRLGVIEFAGAEDTSSTITVGARIEALTDATWSASENGSSLLFYTTDGNASQSEVLKLDSSQNATFAGNNYLSNDKAIWMRNNAGNADTSAIFTNTSDELVLRTGGSTDSLKINTSGNATFAGDVSLNSAITLGVSGLTNGKINTPEAMYFNIDSNNSQTDTEFVWGCNRTADSGGTELMRLTESGNVGIGVSSSLDHKLTIKTSATGGDWVKGLQSDGGQGFRIGADSGDDAFFELGSAGTSDMVLLSADGDSHFKGGNVGIGMTPSSRLSIKANGDTSTVLDIHGRSSDDYAIISFKENASQTVKGNIQVTGSDSMIFRTGPSTNALTIDSNQVVELNAGQLKFPASQNASSDANTLDDYEEGDWTPVLSDGSNNFTMSANQNGRYTKIGRVVHFEAECGTSSIGSASGALKLIGLPFTSASSTSEGVCSIGFLRAFNYSADTIQLMAQVNGGTTEIAFFASKDDATEETVQCSQADSSSFFIRISGTYFV